MHALTLTDLILDSNGATLSEACDILACNADGLADALAEALPHQVVALEMLAGLSDTDPVTPIEMLDLTDSTLQRRSMGAAASRRLATWHHILSVCPIARGAAVPAASLSLPHPSATLTLRSSPRTLNRQIRALSRVLWGAAWMRQPDLAIGTERQYTLGDLQPVFAEIIACAMDDLRLARRARQLNAALATYHARRGTAHAGGALAAELGVVRGR